MKKLLSAVLVAAAFCFGGCAEKSAAVQNDRLYFFYADTCPHCHEAEAYIRQKHPGLKMEKVDVQTPQGYALFVKCAEKFNLGQRIGTPLFCMGDNYLMGWAPEYTSRFDAYAQPFL